MIIKASNTDDLIIIDDEDAKHVLNVNKKWAVGRNKYGNICSISARYKQTGPKIQLSRLIMGVPFSSTHLDVDHKDRNRLNNQKSNLQLIPHCDNCRKTVRPLSSSGYRGVSWSKEKKKWVARIRTDLGRIHLGYFESTEEAANAYDKAAMKYNGKLNSVLNSNPNGLKEIKL